MNSQVSARHSSWKQWVAGFAAASTLFHHSVDVPWIFGPFDAVHESLEAARNVGLVVLGAIIGAILADTFGRKRTLLAALIFVIPRFIPIVIDSEKWIWIMQIFIELGSGVTCTVVPLYICEIAPTNNRGKFMVLQLLVHLLGMTAIVGALLIYQYSDLNEAGFRGLNGVFLVIPILFHGITLAIFPETPHYLNSKKRYQEAAESLAFFGGVNHVKIRQEAIELTTNTGATNNRSGFLGKIREITQLENRRGLAMIFSLIWIRWVSGQYKNVILLFQWASGYYENAHLYAVIGTLAAMLIFAIFTTFTIDLFRRKIPLVLVIVGCFIAAILGIVAFIFYPSLISVALFIQHLGHLILVGCTLAYTGEFFSINVRAIAIAVVISFEILIRNIILSADHLMTPYSHIFFCGGAFFVAFIFVLVFFPKTKKLPSFEIPIETFTGGQFL